MCPVYYFIDIKFSNYIEYVVHMQGTGDNVNTYFWCRLCAMAHAANITSYQHTFDDVNNWWRGPSVCRERFGNNLWPKW
ncbi:hypothetical protein EB796_010529 [Bugula neritina]|uniref:Uncharacterized protein n=1 Tax=Bugula neritina TaxID=10212 RepID=A0A7J7JZT4_BUGNE|nr:hypothetical protein EB796_010529 [Bugula neritina]